MMPTRSRVHVSRSMPKTAAVIAAALFGVLAALSAPIAAAQQTAAEWLEAMSAAVQSASYDGVVVYRSGDSLETMRIVHGMVDGVERERLVSLTGESREILRTGDDVICVLPEQKRRIVDGDGAQQLLPTLSVDTIRALADHYTFEKTKRLRVADRPAQGIAVLPRDRYRYGYRIWLDEQHKIPLKVVLTGADGTALEELIFTQILFPDRIAPQAFESQLDRPEFTTVGVVPSLSGRAMSEMAKADSRAAAQAQPKPTRPTGEWLVTDLPPGFTLKDQRPAGTPARPITHLMLSDGLASVSIFAAANPTPKVAFEGTSSMGAVHAYGRMKGEHHIAVVGEVPVQTVERIGNGLRYAEPPGSSGPSGPSGQ